jgi:hypothetical protein
MIVNRGLHRIRSAIGAGERVFETFAMAEAK